jgi:hypothetical protein
MVISNTSPGQRRAKPCKPVIWFNPQRNAIRSSTSQQGKIECQNITVHGNGCERTFHLNVQRSEQVFQLTFQCAHGLVAFFKTRSGTPRKDRQLCGNPHKEKKSSVEPDRKQISKSNRAEQMAKKKLLLSESNQVTINRFMRNVIVLSTSFLH